MNIKPLISVVMPVYNSEKYLEEAIESVLNQTFEDFEFIIVDDGSTDKTESIIKKYIKLDSRIHLYRYKHKGISFALNVGCGLARGVYIARMDSDDICFPNRFKKQVRFMKTHPDIGILGTAEENIDGSGNVVKERFFPLLPGFIKWSVIFGGWCLSHPTVMMRRDIVKSLGFYKKNIFSAQDYDLWSRAVFVTKIINIPEILIQRRIWSGNLTFKNVEKSNLVVARAMRVAIKRESGLAISEETAVGILELEQRRLLRDSRCIKSVITTVLSLYGSYVKNNDLCNTETVSILKDLSDKLYDFFAGNKDSSE